MTSLSDRIFEGRRCVVFNLEATATAGSGFSEATYTFPAPFNSPPYIIGALQIQSDATKFSLLVKTKTTNSVTFRIGNTLSSDVPVVIVGLAIGA